MTSEHKLHALFTERLDLPPDAARWLLDLWAVIQVFDDVADADNVPLATLHDAVWRALIAMPDNAFYVANASSLLPVLANAFLKWVASDCAERAGAADEKSFVWRASYYDVVLMVVLLVHGKDAAIQNAATVMSLYGEKYADYKTEFPDA